LDKATERYNELLTTNRKLRDSITGLRHELGAYSTAWRKLEKKQAEVKKKMGELVQKTNDANSGRDGFQVRLLKMKELQTRERESSERELKELARKKEADAKLKAFLEEKIRNREDTVARKIEVERRKMEVGSGSLAGIGIVRGPRETIEVFDEVMADLRELVASWDGAKVNWEMDTRALIQRFAALEDRGYSLFGYVNELGMKAAGYRAKLETMKAEIEKEERKREGKEMGEGERRDKLEVNLANNR
jgi:chromosome segregation ATPase